MGDEKVRWTIVVPRSLDLRVRKYLGECGMKKGALSNFVEQAVLADLEAWDRQERRAAGNDRN